MYHNVKVEHDRIKEKSVTYSVKKEVRDIMIRQKDLTMMGPDDEAQSIEESPADVDRMMVLVDTKVNQNRQTFGGGFNQTKAPESP